MINSDVIKAVAGIELPISITFNRIGNLSTFSIPNMLSWLFTERYLHEVIENPNIKGLIVTPELQPKIPASIYNIVHDDPIIPASALLDYQSRKLYTKFESVVHPTASIHPTAFISDYNVIIGRDTKIEALVSINADVVIGERCNIKSGAVVGSDNFSKFRSLSGKVTGAFSRNGVRIENDVEIGSNCCIDKGDSEIDTIIGEGSKLHNLCQISHGVHIGKECIFWGNVFLSGFVIVGNKVQIQPGAVVSNHLTIGENAFIGLHSIVTKNVDAGKTYLGGRMLNDVNTLNRLKESFKKNND